MVWHHQAAAQRSGRAHDAPRNLEVHLMDAAAAPRVQTAPSPPRGCRGRGAARYGNDLCGAHVGPARRAGCRLVVREEGPRARRARPTQDTTAISAGQNARAAHTTRPRLLQGRCGTRAPRGLSFGRSRGRTARTACALVIGRCTDGLWVSRPDATRTSRTNDRIANGSPGLSVPDSRGCIVRWRPVPRLGEGHARRSSFARPAPCPQSPPSCARSTS
jgi:hypothetical protein